MRDELVERQQPAVRVDDQAQPLPRSGERAVVGTHRRRQPALVDAAAGLREREVVVRVQADATAGVQNARGTQAGASRTMPSPASRARSKPLAVERTLSYASAIV
ncbi:hypothetical protein [Microbacterium elymi]|uniref:Uncharacterized protein n=1 Tax=Microbacterium elymi TaxID=2909587 RepID=A0ABY5NIM9_9MICO|nr:hypothetical protein [Microbacterium elymi]UUT35037.1 hypothetical protein L2X98_32515 [Microbacterium elymi]